MNISLGSKNSIEGSKSFQYSLEDEKEAFARGGIWGQSSNYTLPEYAKLPLHRTINPVVQYKHITKKSSPQEAFREMANVKKAAIRYNGETYYFNPKPTNSDK